MTLHLDLEQIWKKNSEKQGPGVLRKYGCIINTADNMRPEQVKKLREKNKKQYGLSSNFVGNLHLPKARVKEWLKVLTIDQIVNEKSGFSSAERVHHLQILVTALSRKLKKLEKLQKLANFYKPCNVGIIVHKISGKGGISDICYEYVDSVYVSQTSNSTNAESLQDFEAGSLKPQPKPKGSGSSRKQV